MTSSSSQTSSTTEEICGPVCGLLTLGLVVYAIVEAAFAIGWTTHEYSAIYKVGVELGLDFLKNDVTVIHIVFITAVVLCCCFGCNRVFFRDYDKTCVPTTISTCFVLCLFVISAITGYIWCEAKLSGTGLAPTCSEANPQSSNIIREEFTMYFNESQTPVYISVAPDHCLTCNQALNHQAQECRLDNLRYDCQLDGSSKHTFHCYMPDIVDGGMNAIDCKGDDFVLNCTSYGCMTPSDIALARIADPAMYLMIGCIVVTLFVLCLVCSSRFCRDSVSSFNLLIET